MSSQPTYGVANMVTLHRLDEEGILRNLEIRFQNEQIYTWIGPVLIALNPYKLLPIYEVDTIHSYQCHHNRIEKEAPHLFSIGKSAFKNVIEYGTDQCIIISGESGAGKTENAKMLLQYLSAVGGQGSSVEKQIIESNPIMEAFGNAKTSLNDNSSRFGKYIEVKFNPVDKSIVGARINQYLLEKSRIVAQVDGERNYHVFYYMLAGLPLETKREYGLIDQCSRYNILSRFRSFDKSELDEGVEFKSLNVTLKALHFNSYEIVEIWRLLAALLHLGNVEFKEEFSNGMDSSYSDEASQGHLIYASRLLDLSIERLNQVLTTKQIRTSGDCITTKLNRMAAIVARDSLIKYAYNNLFLWLIDRLNDTLAHDEKVERVIGHRYIGILDIFGFEKLVNNSFEQLCINFANESFQQFFVRHMFKREQNEYLAEGIDWSWINFIDNQETLNLIVQQPISIFSILNDECRFPRTSDLNLKEKLDKNLANHPKYIRTTRVNTKKFGVKHFAGDVLYTIDGMLDKNKDLFHTNFTSLINSTSNNLLCEIFNKSNESMNHELSTPSKSSSTLTMQFKSSLQHLMDKVQMCQPSFIRCVKPNETKSPCQFDPTLCLRQLRYSGMLETIRVRKAGYSIRHGFGHFIAANHVLIAFYRVDTDQSDRETASNLCQAIFASQSDYCVGHTKLFLKDQHQVRLRQERERCENLYATIIQRNWRRFIESKRFIVMRKTVCKLQALVKAKIQHSKYQELRNRVIFIQRLYRARLSRRRRQEFVLFITRVKALTKGWLVRDRLRRMERAALVIQAAFRAVNSRRLIARLKGNCSLSIPRPVRPIRYEFIAILHQHLGLPVCEIDVGHCERASRVCILQDHDQYPTSNDGIVISHIFSQVATIKQHRQEFDFDEHSSRITHPDRVKSNSLYDSLHFGDDRASPPEWVNCLCRDVYSTPFNWSFSRISLTKPLLKINSPEDGRHAVVIWSMINRFMELPIEKSTRNSSSSVKTARTYHLDRNLLWRNNTITESSFVAAKNDHVQCPCLATKSSHDFKLAQIVRLGLMRSPELRDEIFCQLCKQLTNNPVKTSEDRGFLLLALCVGCFTPSCQMLPVIVQFLSSHLNTKWARYCNLRLERTLSTGNRLRPPGLIEQDMVTKRHPTGRRMTVTCPNGYRIDVDVDSSSRAGELVSQVADQIGLNDRFGFAIHLKLLDKITSIGSRSEFLFDALSLCEDYLIGKSLFCEPILLFRKEIFAPWHNPSFDPVANNLIVEQLLLSVCLQDSSENNVLKKAVIIYFKERIHTLIRTGCKNLALEHEMKFIEDLFSKAELQMDTTILPDKWLDRGVDLQSIQYNHDRTQRELIEFARDSWPAAFTQFFTISQYSAPSRSVGDAIVGVSAVGMSVLDGQRALIDKLPFAQLYSVSKPQDTMCITLLCIRGHEYTFKCNRASELHEIIEELFEGIKRRSKYALVIADTTFDQSANHLMRVKQGDLLTLERPGRLTCSPSQRRQAMKGSPLCYACNQCTGQRGLIPFHLVHVLSCLDYPSDQLIELYCSSFFKLTSKQQGEPVDTGLTQLLVKDFESKEVNYNSSITLGEFDPPELAISGTLADFASVHFRSPGFLAECGELETLWQHNRIPIEKPLLLKTSLMHSSKRKAAVNSFCAILDYMSDCNSHLLQLDDDSRLQSQVHLISEIFWPFLSHPTLCDEIYCQIIKQLTFNPNEASSSRGWELMQLATSLAAPSCYLFDELTAILNAKLDEHPRVCLCFNQLIDAKSYPSRQLPPYITEVKLVLESRSSIKESIELYTGQAVLVKTNSRTMVDEVCRKAIRKSNSLFTNDLVLICSLSDIKTELPQLTYLYDCISRIVRTTSSTLRDIQELDFGRFGSRQNDSDWRKYHLQQSNDSYSGLYMCLLSLSENIKKLPNQYAICEHILRTLHSLLIFLDFDHMEGVPLAVAWLLVYFPVTMHSNVMELMCSVIVPLVYNFNDDQESFALDSIPAILTLVFQQVEKIEYHVWILECFLSKKKELHKDLLMIIAYGPTEARLPAVCLLFHYWPETYPAAFYANPTLQPIHYNWEPWKPLTCDRTDCPNKTGKALAMKMTVNPKIAAQHANQPPPLYVCLDCVDALNRRDFNQLVDILLPSRLISLTCESKICRSPTNQAVVTCWSSACTCLNGNRAIRFCDSCHTLRHSYGQLSSGLDSVRTLSFDADAVASTSSTPAHAKHIYQIVIPDIWDMGIELQPFMMEAIVRLSQETVPNWRLQLTSDQTSSSTDDLAALGRLNSSSTQPPGGLGNAGPPLMTTSSANVPPGGPPPQLVASGSGTELILTGGGVNPNLLPPSQSNFADFGQTNQSGKAGTAGGDTGGFSLTGRYTDDDHRVLAVYAALLVGEKCRPREGINIEILTRLTAGIFNWFLDTIYTANDEIGNMLERVKSEYILKWIQEVQRSHFEAILAVLLPHPVEHARIGSCWDALCDRTTQVKHGLSRIGSLIPYEIITFETWDFIMPFWLETIRAEVPNTDLAELEILLKKIFDETAGPFPFLPQKVYHFASERFNNTSVDVQDQVLSWLEILTNLDVPIPMKELTTMFRSGVEAMKSQITPHDDQIDVCLVESDDESEVSDVDQMTERDLHEELPDEIICRSRRRRRDRSSSTTDKQASLDEEDDYYESGEKVDLIKSSERGVSDESGGSGKEGKRTSFKKAFKFGRDHKNKMAESYDPDGVDQSRERSESSTSRVRESKRSTKTPKSPVVNVEEYHITSCLNQMLYIAYRQLKLHDPSGHIGYGQETPQLLLGLLGDMLQLYWGDDFNLDQIGIKDRCLGCDSCIFPTDSQTASSGEDGQNPVAGLSRQGRSQQQANLNNPDLEAVDDEIDDVECIECLDMIGWLSLAELLCQHLAPVRNSTTATVDFTSEALTKTSDFSVCVDWRESSLALTTSSPDLPRPADLLSMPPVVRVVYLLSRFIHDPLIGNDDQSLPRLPTDPIVLQCVVECLAYLCHIGDCLLHLLNKAERDRASPSLTINGSRAVGGRKSIVTSKASTSLASIDAQVKFVTYLMHQHLIPGLWGLLKSDLSQLASWTVPILLHSISIPGGPKVLWTLIESNFAHSDWQVRFGACEKAGVLLRELDPLVLAGEFRGAARSKLNVVLLTGSSRVSSSGISLFNRSIPSTGGRGRGRGGPKTHPLHSRNHGGSNSGRASVKVKSGSGSVSNESPLQRTAVAHLFSCLIGSLDDSNSVIAQYAASQLASINNMALQCCVQCLEFQFDSVISDRCLILQRMQQLSSALPDRQVFTWDFFVDRFGLLAIQAQMTLNGQREIDSVTDFNGYHRNSEHFQNQFDRACFALTNSNSLGSIARSAAYIESTASVNQDGLTPIQAMLNELFGTSSDSSTSVSAGLMGSASREGRVIQSEPISASTSVSEFTDGGNKFLCSIRNLLDQESSDKDALHQWVSLLLKFMASIQLAYSSGEAELGSDIGSTEPLIRHASSAGGSSSSTKDDLRDRKALSKAQRHMAFLLGYSDRSFTITPQTMRSSTVFHAFLAHIAGVLDRSFTMGLSMLHQTLVVLQYCASPQRYATDTQPPSFTLRLLEARDRIHWLQTLLIILYKYEYGGPVGSSSTGGSSSGVNFIGPAGLSIPAPATPTGLAGVKMLRKSSSEVKLLQQLDQPDSPHLTGPNAGQSTFTASSTPLIGLPGVMLPPGGGGGSVSGTGGAPVASAYHQYPLSSGLPVVGGGFTSVSGGTRGAVEYLIQVVINTLDAQVHVCREPTEDEQMDPPTPPLRLREVSNVSSEFNPIVETDTPPASPTDSQQQLENADEDDAVVIPGVTVTCQHTISSQSEADDTVSSKTEIEVKVPTITTRTGESKHATLSKETTGRARSHSRSHITSLSPPGIGGVGAQEPSTVSTNERSIHAPVVQEGIELTILKSRTISRQLPESPKLDTERDSTRSPRKHALRFETSPVQSRAKSKHTKSMESRVEAKSGEEHERVSPCRTRSQPDASEEESESPATAPVRTGSFKRPSRGGVSPIRPPDSGAVGCTMLGAERCPWCNRIIERYEEASLSMGMLCLATFVHREPSLAAPYLKDMMLIAVKLANTTLYSWQAGLSHVIVPGNVSSIARQFLRCTMFDLAPNGLFLQLFQTPIPDEQFFRGIIAVLVDFEEHMSFFQPITLLVDALNKRKTLPSDTLPIILENLANYLENIPIITDDSKMNHFLTSGWGDIIGPLELLFRKLPAHTPIPRNLATAVRIMTSIIRSPVASNFKTLPDTFAAVLRVIVENVHFKLSNIVELCSLSSRTLKERQKGQLSKTIVEILHQAIKFRICLPDENLMKLLQFILIDAGGTVEPNQIVEGLTALFNPQTYHLYSTGAAEMMRPHLTDCIAFISDVHTMHKVKQTQKAAVQINAGAYDSTSQPNLLNNNTAVHSTAVGGIGGGLAASSSLHEDVLGAHLKAGLAQYVSLELSSSKGGSDEDVIPLLAPGLVADIWPIRPQRHASYQGKNRSIVSPGPTTTDTAATLRHTRSTTGRGLDEPSSTTSTSSNRLSQTAEKTLIVITPSVDSGADRGSSSDLQLGARAESLINSPSGFSITSANSRLSIPSHHNLPAVDGGGLAVSPGGPPPPGGRSGGGYGHVTLAPMFSRLSTSSDAPILQHLPWLKSIPPSAQLGPRDFLVLVERVRTLSWLLIGATMNMALTREATGLTCRPIPLSLVRTVTDLVKALLSSFPDQQKQSVTVMSSLYHAFLLCQMWTVYCEAAASLASPNSVQHKAAIATTVDFWTRMMPTILRLLSISEDFVIVSGRLLNVIEELIECQCSVVTQLLPLWISMLCARNRQLPGNMLKRLQKCTEWEPPEPYNRLLLLMSIPPSETESGDSNTTTKNLLNTQTSSLPGLTSESLLACSANCLNGCSRLPPGASRLPDEGPPIGPSCAGHALAPSTPYAHERTLVGQGLAAGALGTDLLTSRLVAWLKKQIFVLGRNEDQHSTATHIFVQ